MSSLIFSRLKLKIAKRFENHVFELLKKDFESAAISEQFHLDNGKIPDFVIENDRKLIVVDAKAKEVLSKGDIAQLIDYIVELDADEAFIYVAGFTEVSESVEDYAILNGIEIVFTNW